MRRIWPDGGGVYAVRVGGQLLYVGYTQDFAHRFNLHKSALRKGTNKNAGLQAAYNDNPDVSFLALEELDEKSRCFAQTIERAWILWLGNSYKLANVEYLYKGRGGVPFL